jgi:hypothetical protein
MALTQPSLNGPFIIRLASGNVWRPFGVKNEDGQAGKCPSGLIFLILGEAYSRQPSQPIKSAQTGAWNGKSPPHAS